MVVVPVLALVLVMSKVQVIEESSNESMKCQ